MIYQQRFYSDSGTNAGNDWILQQQGNWYSEATLHITKHSQFSLTKNDDF